MSSSPCTVRGHFSPPTIEVQTESSLRHPPPTFVAISSSPCSVRGNFSPPTIEVQTESSHWYPLLALIAIFSSPCDFVVVCKSCNNSNWKQKMYVRTGKQPAFVNCFKWSLLVRHNAHSLYQTYIACTRAPCTMHHMLVWLQNHVQDGN